MTGYDAKESDRLYEDAKRNYKGKCPSNLYPVTVTGIKGGTWVETSQPKRPPDNSFNFVQEHYVEIEFEQDGSTFREHRYNGPDQGGVPFITNNPVALEEPFRCRARARWGMQDAHPENRGFMALPGYDGRTYYGDWSAWSKWFSFPTEEEKAQREKESQEQAALDKAKREHDAAVKRLEEQEAERDKKRQAEFDAVAEMKKNPLYVARKDDLKEDGQFTIVDPRVVGAAGANGRYWTQWQWNNYLKRYRETPWLTFDEVEAYIKKRRG